MGQRALQGVVRKLYEPPATDGGQGEGLPVV
jgi:hypothetical protein